MVFNIFKKNSTEQNDQDKTNLFSRLKSGLTRTRNHFASGISTLLLGKKQIDEELFEALESYLLSADVGMKVTENILKELTAQVKRKALNDPKVLLDHLKQYLIHQLKPYNQSFPEIPSIKPQVILVVGVNGTGKTTTIGKLTHHFQQEGAKVLLAAGDTFRAAAVDQLKIWGERNQVPVIAQKTGADSAAVIHDAILSAKANNYDIVIADTAGRLHTQSHLMDELKKVVRVIKKIEPSAPHEILLVLDAGIGQNALNQAQHFKTAVGVSGLVLTKLDGTAKGGIVFAITQALKIPIRFIGVGEGLEDLQSFEAESFVNALFANEDKLNHE